MRNARPIVKLKEFKEATHVRANEVETVVFADVHKGRILRQETIARMQHCAPVTNCCCYDVGHVKIPFQDT